MSAFLFRLNLVSVCYPTLIKNRVKRHDCKLRPASEWKYSACMVKMRWALCVSRLFMMSPAQDDSSCIWNALTLETGKKRTNVISVCVKGFKLVSARKHKGQNTKARLGPTSSVRVNSFGGGIQVMIFRVLIRVSVCATYIQYIKHADHTVCLPHSFYQSVY